MQSSDARILRGAAIPTCLAGLAAIVISLAAAGSKGALGALIGTAVVIAFFSISMIVVSYASKVSPQLMMAAAMFSYIVKLLGVLALIAALDDVTIWNSKAFGWTVIALTLAWIGAEIRTTIKTKTLYAEPAEAPKSPADRGP